MAAFIVVIAVIAGGAWILTRPDGSSTSDAATTKSKDAPSERDADDDDVLSPLGIDPGSTATTPPAQDAAPDAGATTTSPVDTTSPRSALTWTSVRDPASGLRWDMPAAEVTTIPDMVILTVGGPLGPKVTYGTFDHGLSVDVTVWDPSNHATQTHIDEIMAFDHDYHHRINEPYGKQLTLAGVPALAVLSTPEPDNTYVAMALVDGTLVRVQVSASGEPVDPEIFERLVASFARN